jgi:TIR domain
LRPSDIFISYAQEDRPTAQRLAQPLEALGWSVWWDRVIAAGRTFDDVIEEAINSAKCVVVLWSKSSVASRWVRAEAEEGALRGVLVPVMIEQAKIPLAFRRIQAADLMGWDGSRTPGFERLIADIASLIGQPHDQLKGHVLAVEGMASTAEVEHQPAPPPSVPEQGQFSKRPKAAARPELQHQPPPANADLTLGSRSPLAGLPRWRRWLLLYWPRGAGGWVFRLLFFLNGAWALVGVAACTSGSFHAKDWGILGGLIVTTWLWWRAASWFDKRS